MKDTERLKEEIQRLKERLSFAAPELSCLLKRRGFEIFSKNPEEDMIFQSPRQRERIYEYMKRYAFRIFLRDVIRLQDGFSAEDVSRYASFDMTKKYISVLLDADVLEKINENRYRLIPRIRSFGNTLVWFITEVLKREFCMESLWGVKFRGRSVGGDYDILSNLTPGICFIEVKSSPPRQIDESEVRAFIERAVDLCPEISMFFLDTHLRMKDKIVALFEDVMIDMYSYRPAIVRLYREVFHVEDTNIYILNAKPSIKTNLSEVFGHYYRRRCLR